jgi:hypothetical protein
MYFIVQASHPRTMARTASPFFAHPSAISGAGASPPAQAGIHLSPRLAPFTLACALALALEVASSLELGHKPQDFGVAIW